MANKEHILVVISLRGGCDGLNLVGPSADPIYISERTNGTLVERTGDNAGLPLVNTLADVDFRFHNKAVDLKKLYDAKELAIIHACGLENGTRSHFDAIDYIERGSAENKSLNSGWITRFSEQMNFSGVVPIAAINASIPTSLLACDKAVAIPDIGRVKLQNDNEIRKELLKMSYNGSDKISENAKHTIELIDFFTNKIPKDLTAKIANQQKDKYKNELGNSLRTLAALIKMDIGLSIATVDFGGWDTHVGQAGRFNNLVDALSTSLFAFWNDLESYHEKMTVVVMSEFGRRLKSNDSGGTDHGHGGVMMLLGGNVKGGNIYGNWAGLKNENLDNQVDLAATTDYRSVISEVITNSFGQVDIPAIFPKFSFGKHLNIIR